MQDLRAKIRIAVLIAVTVWISLAATYGILKPISNGCIMTYMYPTYIPISSPVGLSSEKYGVYLYHEGWKKIDFKEHLKKLNGVPVLFIPGNGGSYKQARCDPWQLSLIGLTKEALLSKLFIRRLP
ncbi:hypothetical protein IC575_007995 [Cucumis melo]